MTMSMLSYLLAHWARCSPLARDVLCQCANIVSSKSVKRFKLECVGSGVALGTTSNVKKLFDEYRVFLGHGGQEIQSVDQIPTTFDDVLVLSRHTFRGVCKKQVGVCDIIYKLSWNPQGTQVACLTANRYIIRDGCTFNAVTYDRFETLSRTPFSSSRHLAWSPNGNTLAALKDSELMFLENSTIFRQKLDGGGSVYSSIKWSPSGKYLAARIAYGHASLAVYTQAGKLVKGVNARIGCIEWHPFRDELFMVNISTRFIQQLDCSTWSISNKCGPWESGVQMACHPDGKMLTILQNSNILWVDEKTGENVFKSAQEFLPNGHGEELKWNSTGSTLAVVRRYRTACIITLWSATGERKKKITIHNQWHMYKLRCSVQWNCSGSHFTVTVSTGVLRVYDSDGNLVKTLDADQIPRAQDVAWHPTKNELLASENTVLQLWH